MPISPRSPRADLASVLVEDRQPHQGSGPARRGEPLGGDGAVGAAVVCRRHHRDHHRGLGLTEELGHRPAAVERLGEPRHRHRGRAVPEALEAGEVRGVDLGVAEHHVDERRRQERVGDRVPREEVQEGADVGGAHDHHLAAEGEHGEAEHPRGMREGCQREVDRSAFEGVADQGERRHRLEVGVGEHHALGTSGRAAGADDHGDVVDVLWLREPLVGPEEVVPRQRPVEVVVEADQGVDRGQVTADLVDQGCEGAGEEEHGAVEEVEELTVLGGLVARVDGAPHGGRSRDPEDAGERGGVVGREDRDLVAGTDAPAGERDRHPPGGVLDLAVGA